MMSDYEIQIIRARIKRVLADIQALNDDIEKLSEDYVFTALGLNDEILGVLSQLENF